MATSLTELLDQALGSGEDAGAVNFNLLKDVLGSVLIKLEIENDPPRELPPSSSDAKQNELEKRLDDLEKSLDDLTRPTSPNSLINDSKKGGDAIKNDWEKSKLKKRVDANEEGVNKAHDILDQLAKQIQDIKDDLDETKDKLKSEQDGQNEAISENKKLLSELDDKLAKQSDLDEQREHQMNEIQEKLNELDQRIKAHDDEINKCVTWDQLDDSFKRDFFNDDAVSEDCLADERKSYPNYFKGLETLSDYGKKIDDLLSEMAETNETLDKVKDETGNHPFIDFDRKSSRKASSASSSSMSADMSAKNEKAIDDTNSNVSDNEKGINDLDSKLEDILKENNKLRNDLERYKAATDRVGDENTLSQNESMKLHDELSSVAESCLELKKRVKQIENNVDKNVTSIGKQGDSISSHETTLDNHTEQINDLINLKNDLNQIHSNIDSLNRFKELQAQRDELNSQQPGEINNETIGKLQEALSGTKEELSHLADLISRLSADGNQKNKELEELQDLLRDLQDRAAMRDYVVNNLDKKADVSDLEGMLSKDDLDSTAQAIINQLEDLINKQAASEAQLQTSIRQVGDEMDERTKNEEFNPFKDEIEKRLRALRKKIEASRKEDLADLTTPAGAAGFRQQLYNCISCDRDIHMRMTKPILPGPTAFPARISLRPHTSFDMEHSRNMARGVQEGKVPIDPLRREHTSPYSNIVVEKELERRRKLRENRIRQEINTYSFKSGSIPRQVGGTTAYPPQPAQPYYVDKDLRKYEMTRNAAREMEAADLEGTNGQLYKGRVARKLPDIARRSPEPDDVTNRVINQANEDDHIQHTGVVND